MTQKELALMKMIVALCKLLGIDPMDLDQAYHEFVVENPDWLYENAEKLCDTFMNN